MLNGCKTGQAKMTKGYRLKARHVIHTVGQIWHGGGGHEAELLRSCYAKSLRLAADAGLKSLAFPCISTGVYGYPAEAAAETAVAAVREFVSEPPSLERILFCCFSERDLGLYRTLLAPP